jgi:hypothetical protein
MAKPKGSFLMKKKILFLALYLVLCSLLTSRPLYAAWIRTFTVTPTSTAFADQDPDFGEVTSSPSLSVTISARQLYANQSWTLAIQANTDLVSGGNTIPAGNIRWTVTGSGTPTPTFYNGTLVRGVYLTAGQGRGQNNGRADITSSFYFYLTNAWSYPTGNYSGTVTLRLTVPALFGGGTQSQTQNVTLSTNIGSRAKLQFGLLAMNFPDANPDSVPSNPANVNPLSVTSIGRTGSSQTVTLTCLASGDFFSGSNTIAISDMTWTATGTGYVPGTMNRITAQTAGSWTGSGQRAGTFSYFLANSWSYIVGNYSTSINYTLTAP